MSTVKARQEEEAKRDQKLADFLSLHNKRSKETPPEKSLMDYLCPYTSFFINDGYSYQFKTKSSSREKKLLELVRHVFAKYRVPSHLTNIWLRKLAADEPLQVLAPRWNYNEQRPQHRFIPKMIQEDPISWYLCVAQGGSLYKQHANKYLTKREVHTFLNHTHELTFEQSLVFSIAMTFAEREGIALRIAKSKLSEKTLTEFLKTVIYFFAKNPPKDIDEVNDLTDFIMHRHGLGLGNPDRPPFTMSGHTLDSLRKKCQDWHYELRRVKVMGDHKWEGAPLPDETLKTKNEYGNTVQWHFKQIKNSKDLAAEGTHMRHCVYSYRDRCIRNEVYIWSLSKEEYMGVISKKVTIELRNDGTIVQARGVANRPMKSDEKNVVGMWAKRNGLRFGSYL